MMLASSGKNDCYFFSSQGIVFLRVPGCEWVRTGGGGLSANGVAAR